MAYGRPTVISDSGGNAELVADGESGIVVPAGDAEALAAGILQLYENPELRAQYGAEARRRVQDIFNIEQGVAKTLAVYRELARPD